MLFHITTREAWEQGARDGTIAADSLEEIGFVHLSTADQWPRTAARFFAGRTDLVLLTIDPSRLGGEVRFEQADGEAFPHLYASLEAASVIRVEALGLDREGIPTVRTEVR